MKNGNGFLKLMIAALLMATAALAQVAPGAMPEAIIFRGVRLQPQLSQHPMTMTHGVAKAMDSASTDQTPTDATTAKLFIFADDGQTAPGRQAVIRTFGLNASDADNLVIFVRKQFIATDGTITDETNPCDCGDSNGGFVPSLVNFNFLTLWSEKVPSNKAGYYKFTTSAWKSDGQGSTVAYQAPTTIVVPSLVQYDYSSDPLYIAELDQISGAHPYIVMTGKFPQNVLLDYFIGLAPYDGGFTTKPSVSSPDGTHLIIPGLIGGGVESRVYLMMPDGSFGTTSAQAFVP